MAGKASSLKKVARDVVALVKPVICFTVYLFAVVGSLISLMGTERFITFNAVKFTTSRYWVSSQCNL